MKKTYIASLLAVVALGVAGCGGEVPVNGTTATQPTGPGPVVAFLGVLRADETLLDPSGTDAAGRPIYVRQNPSGFVLVVDAKPGTNGAAVSANAFNPGGRPNLQIEVSRSIGDGSAVVCDNTEGHFGGVPGNNPPSFDAAPSVSDALNDLGCRFNDGTGNPGGRTQDSACVQFPDGEFHFVDTSATLEFCGFISFPLRFPDGDTIVTARVLDVNGIPGPTRQIVIRIAGF